MGMVVAIVLLIITAILAWIVMDASKLRNKTQTTASLKPALRLTAVGATLAFLPSIIGLGMLTGGKCFFYKDFFWPFMIQGLGAFIMGTGFFMGRRKLMKVNIKAKGLNWAITGCLCGMFANGIFGMVNTIFMPDISLADGCPIILLFLISGSAMALGCFRLSKSYTRFKSLGISFAILSFVLIAGYAMWNYMGEYDASLDDINTIGVFEVYHPDYGFSQWYSAHDFLNSPASYQSNEYIYQLPLVPPMIAQLSFVAMVLTLSAILVLFWRATGARLKDVVTEQPQDIGAGNATRTQPAATEDLHRQLMGMDNMRLKEIVDTPALYNPEVVDKARELLERRDAWEKISYLTDDELLAMTMAAKGIYTENIVEAASMELYQRDSAVLRQQFMALTPDVVAAIADGTASAPEGIRLAAKDFLDKHLKR